MDKIIVFYFLRLKFDLPFDLDQNYYPFGLTRVCLKQAVYTEIAILIKYFTRLLTIILRVTSRAISF